MLNKVFLIGRLGVDPEIKHFDGDKNVSSLSVATYKSYKKPDGEWDQMTEWHRVVVWNRAKGIEKMSKGDFVSVEGENRTRSWEDNGVRKYITEVVGVARAIPKPQGSTYSSEPTQAFDKNAGAGSDDYPAAPAPNDDLPF